jgi:proline racemase
MKFSKMITAVDAHTAGMPMRVVLGGIPNLPGQTMVEKVRNMRETSDYLRSLIVLEPRGHAGMFAAILTEPTQEGVDFGVIFLNPGGYDTMCGHGTIAICTILVETGIVEVNEPETIISLDTPAGVVKAVVAVEQGLAKSVTIQNVASFLLQSDVEIKVPSVGPIKIDVAYGGDLFYAILPAESVGLDIVPEQDSAFVSLGRKIWDVINEEVDAQHPEIPEAKGFAGVIFSGHPTSPKATLKNACFGPPGFTDRSPCGTGTCAKMAALYAKGELALNEVFVHESIIGTLFSGELVKETTIGSYPAVIPTVTGSAYITGFQQLVLDPRDPFQAGFYLGKMSELWGVG